MQNLENFHVFEILITQKSAKMPEGPFCQIHDHRFYGHPFPFAASIRAAICFLPKSGNSIMIYYLGGYLEQCRYVNQFMPTGVFHPFKLTDRSVIIGCNGSDI